MESDFPIRLKALREEQGLSRKELADALGVSSVAVYNWEKGIRRPRRTHVEAVRNFFGLPRPASNAGFMLGNKPRSGRTHQSLDQYLLEAKHRIAELTNTDPARVTIKIDIRSE